MRRAARRDANEPAIVRALEAVGATVYRFHTPVDLWAMARGRWAWLEVKRPDKRGDLTEIERRFLELCAAYGAPAHVVTTPGEALRALGFHVED